MNVMSARAGKLYRDITPAEICMEEAVAELGVPYRIQFPFYLWGVRYFPDFLLPTLKLIIEVDDESHNRAKKKEADDNRTAELNALGWTVVRCTNSEALTDARYFLRQMLKSAGFEVGCGSARIKTVCSLKQGLPQKSARQGKMTRGALRQLQSRQKHPTPASLPRKSELPQLSN